METVTLDQLFRANRPFKLGETPLIARALSGPEHDERALVATHAARKLEKELADPESDAYAFYMRPYARQDEAGLREFLTVVRRASLYNDAHRRHPAIYQPEPDNVTDAERRAIQNQREESETARIRLIDDEVTAALAIYTESLAAQDRPTLYDAARGLAITRIIDERANAAFAYYTIWKGVLTPDGEPYFKTLAHAEHIGNAASFALFEQVTEVDNLNPLALSGPSSTA